jgi:predicted small secreted protein
MNELSKKLGLAFALLIAAFALAGCQDNDVEDAADNMGDAMEDATEEVGDAAQDAVDEVKDATN